MSEFLQRLKQRKLVQWTAAYVAAAFALLQGLDIVAQRFGWPEQTMRLVIIALVVGLFVTIAIAWYHGERGAQRVTCTELLVLALLLALGGGFLWRFASASREPSTGSALLPNERQELAPLANTPENSIAVLPFDNLSHDPDNAYFSEGIQDEILTRLAKVTDLKVISRTSTQRFKSAPADLRQIAQQLGVANILEGSVQRVNDQVRVNVQLIKAATDAHLWAEGYDRKLTDIFGVESEIARTVAETLKAKLTGSAEHVLASKPTEDPEAYQLYLKGRFFWNRRGPENIEKSIFYFREAIDKDPTYALAYAGLADGYSLLPIYSDKPPKPDIERALTAAHRAIALDDTLAEAHTALANALVDDLQFAAAEPEFQRAIELNPNYATAHQWYGEALQGLGRFPEALAQARKAHDLDPLSIIINAVLGSALDTNGKYDEAIQQLQRTLEMEPTFGPALFMLGEVYEDNGEIDKAMEAYAKAVGAGATPVRLAMVARLNALSGKADEARKTLNELTSLSQRQFVPSYPLALIHLSLGEKEEALRLLERAYDERGIQLGGDTGTLKADKRLDPLRGDPRFEALLAKFMGEAK